MRPALAAAGLTLCLAFSLCACSIEGREGYVGRQTGVSLPAAQTVAERDSHGGFHGDGLLLITLNFAPEDGAEVERQILSRGDLWNPGAFDAYLDGILYDGGPAKEGDWPRAPDKSYWYFLDCQEDKTNPVGQRASFNYIAALYDADSATLFYLEFDT